MAVTTRQSLSTGPSKPSKPSKMTDDPKAKAKIIGVSIVLLLAIGWIIYTQMPGGKPKKLTGKAAEEAQVEHEKTTQEIKQQTEKMFPPGKPAPAPAGS